MDARRGWVTVQKAREINIQIINANVLFMNAVCYFSNYLTGKNRNR